MYSLELVMIAVGLAMDAFAHCSAMYYESLELSVERNGAAFSGKGLMR
jgi:hypothetical protein